MVDRYQNLLTVILDRTFKMKLYSLFNSIRKLLINLNLFKRSSRNLEIIYRQKITTRVFVVCLMISQVITSLYAFLSTQTKIITIPNPSRMDYEQLLELHADTLQCSCSQIIVPYSDFIEIIPIFHQLCSSQIILAEWYNRLAQFNKSLLIDYFQFEVALGANYFQVLAMFCALSKDTINNAYRVFSANTLISNRIMSEVLFSKQVKILTDAFMQSTRTEFFRIFSLARNTLQINQLASRTFSNFEIFLDSDDQVMISENLLSNPRPDHFVQQCSCVSQGTKCGIYAYVFNLTDPENPIYLTNIMVKCLLIDSVLSSTLECWYDQNCSSVVLAAYASEGVTNISNILPLDINITSRFPRNITVETMMNELLLENWTITNSYEDFYNKCAPVSCVYSIEQRFDLFFVIVTILGIYSGLSVSLRLILPIIIRLTLIFLQYIRKRSHSNERIQSNGKS